MNSKEMLRHRFEEICEEFEGGVEYPEDFFDEAIRQIVAEEYRHLPAEELEALVAESLSGLSPMAIEGFFSGLRRIGSTALRGMRRAAPILKAAAPALSLIPGYGTVLGGAAGVLGNLLSRGQRSPTSRTAQRPQAPRTPRTPQVTRTAQPPSAALGNLGALLTNNSFLQALLSQLLGSVGRSSVPVGPNRTPVSTGAFMNLLGSLANQAAAEINASGTGTRETPQYLLSESGDFLCDPAVPEERANVLWGMLEQAAKEELKYYPYLEEDDYYEEYEDYDWEDEFEDVDEEDEFDDEEED